MELELKKLKKKNRLILPVILMLAVIFTAGCRNVNDTVLTPADGDGELDTAVYTGAGELEPGEVITLDLSGGERTFTGYEPEMISVEVIRQGEMLRFSFAGISLSRALENKGITEFTKIEMVVSDFEHNQDITDWAKAEAGVFLAWSESGEPETPFRVFPKDAGTGNLLIRNVTGLIITR